jgi:hypothetical protein
MSIAQELELPKLKLAQAEITAVCVTDETLTVELTDGRTITVPIVWFPRLAYGTPEERQHYQMLRDSIHWPDLDEDIGLPTLLLGRGPGESPAALQKWLAQRKHQALGKGEVLRVKLSGWAIRHLKTWQCGSARPGQR